VVEVNGSYGSNIKKCRIPTVDAIDVILRLGGCVALLYHWEEWVDKKGEHYLFIDHVKNGKYHVVNYSFVEKYKYITRRELKNMLVEFRGEESFPQLWYVNV
jgi:hypothetical protein